MRNVPRVPDLPSAVIKGRPYTWRTPEGASTTGVALMIKGRRVVQFLTPDQAINLADQLVDAAETAPTTHNNTTSGQQATTEGITNV